MADDLLGRIGTVIARRPWYQLPRLFAMLRLIEIRNDLREKNLHDTEEPAFETKDIPANLDPALRAERTIDGTFNDLKVPKMGAAGCRFGRNVPLDHVVPDTANLLIPNPRVVSRELMTREAFQPATFLNLLAASWIQFMVHDWFVHKRSATDKVEIPTAAGRRLGRAGDHGPTLGGRRPSTRVDAAAGVRQREQPLVGRVADLRVRRGDRRVTRTGVDGQLRIEPTGLLPVESRHRPALLAGSPTTRGSASRCSTRCSRWSTTSSRPARRAAPAMDRRAVLREGRLINSALMAKIHTVEWTPAILPHPVIQTAMKVNWSGLAGEDLQDLLMFLDDKELAGGIVGSKAAHHAAPYSLTEEFVAVYRMHPLMPDTFDFRSLATGRVLETRDLTEVSGQRHTGRRQPHPDARPVLFVRHGHPGAITLHNYPRTSRT